MRINNGIRDDVGDTDSKSIVNASCNKALIRRALHTVSSVVVLEEDRRLMVFENELAHMRMYSLDVDGTVRAWNKCVNKT